MIGKVIYNLLNNSTDLTSLIAGKIYPSIIQDEETINYIVYERSGTEPTDCKQERSTVDVLTYDIFIFADSIDTLDSISLGVRNALDQFTGVNSGLVVDRITYQSEQNDFDTSSQIFSKLMTFEVRWFNIYNQLGQPTDLTVTGNGLTQLDLSWTDNATGEDGYKVFRSTDLLSWSEIADIAAGSTSYSDTGRTTDVVYYYYVIPYDSNGNGYASDVAGNRAVDNGITPSGIVYCRNYYNPDNASYATYDNLWQLQNNGYDFTNPANPATIQELDLGVDQYGKTLKYNNAFGNKFRFTDDSGNDAYLNSSQKYIIDHFTGVGWWDGNTSSTSWNNTFGSGGYLETQNAGSGFLNYTDWMMPSVNMMTHISTFDSTNANNGYSVLLPYINTQTNYHTITSCTRRVNSNQSMYFNMSNGSFLIDAKTTARKPLLCRIHYK